MGLMLEPAVTKAEAASGQPPSFESFTEACSSADIHGWAWDRNNPHAVFIAVAVDGRHVCTVAANGFREDLKRAGKRGGYCGFNVILPDWLFDGETHHVRLTVLNARPEVVIGDGMARLQRPGRRTADMSPPELSNVFIHQTRAPTGLEKAESAQALIGRNNWLFLANDSNRVRDQLTGKFILPQARLDAYRKVFGARQAWFAKRKIPYLFFVAPTKELICADRLPPGMQVDYDNYPLEQIQRALKPDGFTFRQLRPALAAAETVERTFLRTDTHWNNVGAHHAYRAMVEEISRAVPTKPAYPRGQFASRIVKNWRGDLADKDKVAFIGGDLDVVACDPGAFDPASFQEDVEHLVDESGAVSDLPIDAMFNVSATRASAVKGNRDRGLPKLMVFRDSFAISLMPMLARNFSRSVFLWTPNMLFSVIEKESPDVVIQVMVDRFLVRLPADVA